MNFEHGKSLEKFQDSLFKQYTEGLTLAIEEKTHRRLNRNLWVSVMSRIAPNNFVIRHRCLQDIYNGNNHYLQEIVDFFHLLSVRFWYEDYSSWNSCKDILIAWGKLYCPTILDQVKNEDQKISWYAYKKGKLK